MKRLEGRMATATESGERVLASSITAVLSSQQKRSDFPRRHTLAHFPVPGKLNLQGTPTPTDGLSSSLSENWGSQGFQILVSST